MPVQYGSSLNGQLSDDQFLQWGQTAQSPGTFPDPTVSSINGTSYQSNNIQPSTQLTRRPLNALATRARVDESQNNNQWTEDRGGTPQPGEGPWSYDIEELEQKAQVAKKEAQGKRKQIPPFVQKLNRYAQPISL